MRRGGSRVVDLPYLDPHPEELRLLARTLVEPVKGLPVPLPELLRHPDDDVRIVPARVGEHN